jgi:lipopolysaccharide/colanic/teichoic acid biosynthesis glycosyltransferase
VSDPAPAGPAAGTALREPGGPPSGPQAGPVLRERASPAATAGAVRDGPAATAGAVRDATAATAGAVIAVVPGLLREPSRAASAGHAVTTSAAAGSGARTGLRNTVGRAAPDAVLPLADLAALVPAVLLARVPGWTGVVYGAGVLAVLAAAGLDRLRICLRVSDQVGRICGAAALSLVLVLAWTPSAEALRLVLLTAALVTMSRSAASAGLRAAHRRGLLIEPALVVGTGTTGSQVCGLLLDHPELGLRPRGVLGGGALGGCAPGGPGTLARPADAVPLLGRPADLASVVARHGIRRVIVCPGESVRGDAGRDNEVIRALRACRPLPADVCVVPRLHQLGAAVPTGCLDDVWGIPLIPLRRFRRWPQAQLLKRVFDLIAAMVLIIVLAPVLVSIAVAVRLRSGRPVLFRQIRVVAAGRLAAVIKLRTLREHDDPDTRWLVPEEGCGRFERWLRSRHLDELPQLANVLRGEMSLVGPRPERPYFTDQFGQEIQGYRDRHRMRAGLTGWAQVHGLHGDTSIADRARFDNQYIEYWSPWLDLVILFRTLVGAAGASGGSR